MRADQRAPRPGVAGTVPLGTALDSRLLRSNEKQFRGGLVSKARRLFVSLNSRPSVIKKKKKKFGVQGLGRTSVLHGPASQGPDPRVSLCKTVLSLSLYLSLSLSLALSLSLSFYVYIAPSLGQSRIREVRSPRSEAEKKALGFQIQGLGFGV